MDPPRHFAESLPSLRLRLPATSANLGPGFDTVGLALSLYLHIEAEQAEVMQITATGRDSALCGSTADNLILMTYVEVLGDQGVAAPALRLTITNEIPLGMGLGSSAAALLAGVLLANYFGQLSWVPQQILDEACRREGHPDNVSACLYGGLTVSATTTNGYVGTESRTVASTCGRDLNWSFMAVLPNAALSTTKARALLPSHYSRADAVANLQATALLVSAFALDRPELLSVAIRDRIHQPYRALACPLLPSLLPLTGRHGICGVALSGAGPSVLLIAAAKTPLPPIREAILSQAGDPGPEILELRIADGVIIQTKIR